MKVKLNTDSLSSTRWYEFAVRFVFGGAVTALAGVIAKHYGPAIGGLFLAFPAIFPATATLIEKQEEKKKQFSPGDNTRRGRAAASVDAAGSSMGAIGLLVFGVIVWQGLPRFGTPWVLIAATAAWFTVSVAIWEAREILWRRARQKRKAALRRQGRESTDRAHEALTVRK
jgi:Protein of unknown function (DUF3147)